MCTTCVACVAYMCSTCSICTVYVGVYVQYPCVTYVTCSTCCNIVYNTCDALRGTSIVGLCTIWRNTDDGLCIVYRLNSAQTLACVLLCDCLLYCWQNSTILVARMPLALHSAHISVPTLSQHHPAHSSYCPPSLYPPYPLTLSPLPPHSLSQRSIDLSQRSIDHPRDPKRPPPATCSC